LIIVDAGWLITKIPATKEKKYSIPTLMDSPFVILAVSRISFSLYLINMQVILH
jgi:hypothetical protein